MLMISMKLLISNYKIVNYAPIISYLAALPHLRHVWLRSRSLLSMRKLKLSSDGDDVGSEKCKRGYASASGGVWRSL
jgi:hypothetical protein